MDAFSHTVVAKFAEAFSSIGQGNAGPSAFLTELFELPQEQWPGRLRKLVADQIGLILRRPVDADRPLSEYGLDSLGTLEVRTRIENETGIRIGSTDITTVRALAQRLADTLAGESATSSSS